MSTHPQDVYKDAGECVLFVYLRFNRKDQAAELEAFRDFADRSQAINRSMNIRAQNDDLRVALGVSRKGWDYLFPGAPRPKELEEFTGLTNQDNPSIAMPEGIGEDADLFLHIRAQREAVVYEVAEQYRLSFKEFATVVDETHGFRYLEGRAIIGFIDGTENPTGIDAPHRKSNKRRCPLLGRDWRRGPPIRRRFLCICSKVGSRHGCVAFTGHR